jgi:hypothetical protein
MKLKSGQYIRHSKYGCGTIIERNDERTTVDFDSAGLKKFLTPLAVFEIAEGAPPERKKLAVARRRPRAKAAEPVSAA